MSNKQDLERRDRETPKSCSNRKILIRIHIWIASLSPGARAMTKRFPTTTQKHLLQPPKFVNSRFCREHDLRRSVIPSDYWQPVFSRLRDARHALRCRCFQSENTPGILGTKSRRKGHRQVFRKMRKGWFSSFKATKQYLETGDWFAIVCLVLFSSLERK